jgi:hypothetical protein
VNGIVTQGRKDAAQWLTLYDIYTSTDQNTWNRVSSGENSQVLLCGILMIMVVAAVVLARIIGLWLCA